MQACFHKWIWPWVRLTDMSVFVSPYAQVRFSVCSSYDVIVPRRQTAVVDKTLSGLHDKSALFLSLTSFFFGFGFGFALSCFSLWFCLTQFYCSEVLTITAIIVYISSSTEYYGSVCVSVILQCLCKQHLPSAVLWKPPTIHHHHRRHFCKGHL